MKVIAINGSRRKNGNTAILLTQTLEGARSRGAEVKLVHLYDFDYKGCASCFACKLKGGKSYGKCAWKDEISPILKEIEQTDAIVMGSPIYFGSVSGQMRAFLERLMFPYTTYTEGYKTIFVRKIHTGFIYTMNVTAKQLEIRGYSQTWKVTEENLQHLLGNCATLYSYDTYQFDDYSKYVATVFDEDKKAKAKAEIFPEDCKKAFAMGLEFAEQASVAK